MSNAELIAEACDFFVVPSTGEWDTEEGTDIVRRLVEALKNAQITLDYDKGVMDDLTAKVEAASPRVVSTVAELDALPVGTVVRAADGDVCEKMPVKFSDQTTDIRWRSPAWEGVLSELDIALPATVLWVGGTE